MNKITEELVDNMVHDICARLSSTGIKLTSDLLSDLNDHLTDWFVDECDIDVQEEVTFTDLGQTQVAIWQNLAKTYGVAANKMFESFNGVLAPISADQDSAKTPFKLIDESTNASTDLAGFVDNSEHLGLSIQIKGYGDYSSMTEPGNPIYLEKYNNKLRAIIYSDINLQEPTHIICLDKAKQSNRQDVIRYEHSIVN